LPRIRRVWTRRNRALDLFTQALHHPLPSAPRRWWLAFRALLTDPTMLGTPMGRIVTARRVASALAVGPIRSLGRRTWRRVTAPPAEVRRELPPRGADSEGDGE
jgi:hypothetical protein